MPHNYTDCFIEVNNQRRSWENGKDLIFDDNFWHHVENNTPQRRVVLFVDFLKRYDNIVFDLVNRIFVFLGGFNMKVVDVIRQQNIFHENQKLHLRQFQ